jgi:hypothetical protein
VLPYNRELAVRDEVYACEGCKEQFFVEDNTESGFSKEPKKWVALNSSPYTVEYDKTVDGKPFIGRADADTVFDEEPVDQLAGEVSDGDGQERSSGANSGGNSGDSQSAD